MSKQADKFFEATTKTAARKLGLEDNQRRMTTTQRRDNGEMRRQLLRSIVVWGTPVEKDI